VIYRGDAPVPGSAEALAQFERAGWRVFFCTNNSSRPAGAVAARIAQVSGYSARAEQVIGSADAAASLLEATRPPTYVLGGEGIVEALSARAVPVVADARQARAVVVGLDVGLTYERLRDAAVAVADGARLIATNDDPTYPAEIGFWPGAGSIVAAVEVASGVKAEVAGKPYAPIRRLIKERIGPGPVWVVGDRPETDLELAASEPDWRSVLVLTGVVAQPDGVVPTPDMVATDLGELARRLIRDPYDDR
jgi:4-nitrophenyl phosphatase